MNSLRYSIVLVIVTVLSLVLGQKFTRDERAKPQFRPPGEWFANMRPSIDQSPSYFEQSDQPSFQSQFQDFYVDDYEPENIVQVNGGKKFSRHASLKPLAYQSLCPSSRIDILLTTDTEYEYRPSSYEEVKCIHPFGRNALMHQRNKICGHHGYSCIQLNRTIFLTRRAFGTDCWEVETRVVPSSCDCMWPKHSKGDILTFH